MTSEELRLAVQAEVGRQMAGWCMGGVVVAAVAVQGGLVLAHMAVVRARNITHPITLHLMACTLTAVVWFVAGHEFALGGDSSCLLGQPPSDIKALGPQSQGEDGDGNKVSSELWWVVNWALCASSLGLASGGMAERLNEDIHALFCLVYAGLIYPLVLRAVWSPYGLFGGEAGCGSVVRVIDFGGSGALHLTSGTASVVAALMLGPRIGKFDASQGLVADISSDATGYSLLGTFFQWGGFYGLLMVLVANTDGEVTGVVALNTTLTAMSSCLVTILLTRWQSGRASVEAALGAVLCGLVASSAGCATASQSSTFLTGACAGGGFLALSQLTVHFRVDDTLNGFAVHGWGGLVGLISAGLSVQRDYALQAGYEDYRSGGGHQVGAQALFCLFCLGVSAAVTSLSLLALGALWRATTQTRGLRIPPQEENRGVGSPTELSISCPAVRTGTLHSAHRKLVYTFQQFRASSPMEDRVHVLGRSGRVDTALFGLFDGHLGHECAQFLGKRMLKQVKRLLKDFPNDTNQALKKSFNTMDDLWKNEIADRFVSGVSHLGMCGSCALVAVVDEAGVLSLANVGNSRAFLGSSGLFKEVEVVELSMDHSVVNSAERRRIHTEHYGETHIFEGKSRKSRVKGQLKVTRSIGDLFLKDAAYNCHPMPEMFQIPAPYNPPYISSDPHIVRHQLSEEDRFLVMVSEGIMEFLAFDDIQNVMNEAVCISDFDSSDIPWQLIRMALERAAEKADMSLPELINLPEHDKISHYSDLSVMVICFMPRDHHNDVLSDDSESDKLSLLGRLKSKLSTVSYTSKSLIRKISTPPQVSEKAFILMTDIEDSTQLWERNRDVMYEALMLHQATVRALLGKYGGYEMDTEGDAFILSFRDANSMIKFAMDLQMEHLSIQWPEGLEEDLLEVMSLRALDTVKARRGSYKLDLKSMSVSSLAGNSLWKGLRIRVAMHCGLPTSSQVSGGRILLQGTCIDDAKHVMDSIQSGGQVVCTEEVICCLSDKVVSDLSLVHLGRFCLNEHRTGFELFSVLPQALFLRQTEFRPVKHVKQLALGAFQCPNSSEDTTLVFCSLSQYKQIELSIDTLQNNPLYDDKSHHTSITPDASRAGTPGRVSTPMRSVSEVGLDRVSQAETTMEVVAALYSSVVEKVAMRHNGYIAEAKPGFYLLAFPNQIMATEWATEVQLEMMGQNWPTELLALDHCKEERVNRNSNGSSSSKTDSLLFRGPRLKIGMFSGNLQAVSLNKKTGRAQFFGPGINAAARVAALAHGGQALVALNSESDVKDFKEMISDQLKNCVCTVKGPVKLKGVSGTKRIVQVNPKELASRKFHPIRKRSFLSFNKERYSDKSGDSAAFSTNKSFSGLDKSTRTLLDDSNQTL